MLAAGDFLPQFIGQGVKLFIGHGAEFLAGHRGPQILRALAFVFGPQPGGDDIKLVVGQRVQVVVCEPFQVFIGEVRQRGAAVAAGFRLGIVQASQAVLELVDAPLDVQGPGQVGGVARLASVVRSIVRPCAK